MILHPLQRRGHLFDQHNDATPFWIDAKCRLLAMQRTTASGIPLLRIAEGEDIAASVCFLASNEARQITMQTLVVDGGAGLGG